MKTVLAIIFAALVFGAVLHSVGKAGWAKVVTVAKGLAFASPAFARKVGSLARDVGSALLAPGAFVEVSVFVAIAFALIVLVNFAAPSPRRAPVPTATPIIVKTVKANCPAPKPNASGALMGSIVAFQMSHAAEIKAFQRAHGLPADGIIGPATFNAFIAGR